MKKKVKQKEKKTVRITETVLRDGHQSLAATRMRFSDMEPMLEALDNIGYFSIEAWGGATFDACLRFLQEDPWQRLRDLRRKLVKTPIQMLLRGQNLLGYSPFADDVVKEFVKRSVYNGVTVVRVFDALNDVRNMETAMRAARAEGAHAQGTFVYTISPYHTNEKFIEVAAQLQEIGAHSICIKDMAGLLAPYQAYSLIKDLKAAVQLPIHLHTHYTSGMASMTYLKAIEAGVDIVDCSLSPFAMGPGQPATESLVAALDGTSYSTGINKEALFPIAQYFRKIKKNIFSEFSLSTTPDIDVEVLKFQIPGGMLTNLVNQLKEMGMEDRYEELLLEMPKVRADAGYPPLVTPTSQIVGTMAVMNVMMGRYKQISAEFRDLVCGKYGKTPADIDPEFRKKIAAGEKVITKRPADDIKPQLGIIENKLAELGYSHLHMEDILSYATFPEVAEQFFSKNRARLNVIVREQEEHMQDRSKDNA